MRLAKQLPSHHAPGNTQMTSTRATEETEEDRVHAQRHRGRKVMLAYT